MSNLPMRSDRPVMKFVQELRENPSLTQSYNELEDIPENLELRLPENTKLVERLRLKLDEYKKRMENIDGNNFEHHDTFCKVIVLGELLKGGRCSIRELIEKAGDGFEYYDILFKGPFQNACTVIESYCDDDDRTSIEGGMLTDGTGLPDTNGQFVPPRERARRLLANL